MFLKFRSWIPVGLAITLICGIIYGAVQQDIRQGANDPQIQIAEDLREDLNSGKKIEELPLRNIDLNKSLSQFVIVFDEQNHPLYSEASLDGRIPTPPIGIFDFVKVHNQEGFTWQPKDSVRIAAVVVKFNKGFVLAGRSLREVEKREHYLLLEVAFGWVITILTTLGVSLFSKK